MARHHRTKHSAPRKRSTAALPAMTDDVAELLTASPDSLSTLVQAKLTVGRVDDPSEVEADRAAAAFGAWSSGHAEGTTTPAPVGSQPTSAARAAAGATMATGGFAVGGEVEAEIERRRGGGQSLSAGTRAEFEGFFGADLGGVRIHADSGAAALSRSLGAEAFTVGSDVFFGEGRFAPDSGAGRELLAHELTHVVQQGGPLGRRTDAVAASRSPLVVHRTVAEDIENALTEDPDNEVGTGDVSGVSGTTNDTTGAVSDMSGMEDTSFTTGGSSGGKVEASEDGVGHGDVIGVVNSTVGLVDSLKELYEAFKDPATTKDRVWKILNALKSGADLSKSAITTAGNAAGSLTAAAAGAIPGLGLAISVLSFVDSLLNKLLPLWTANRAESTLLDKVKAKLAAETDDKKKSGLMEQVASLETLVSTTRRQVAFTLADMAGDILQMVGQVATLAAGPFGLAVTALGGLTKLAAGVIGKIWEWVASHRAARAKEASEAATAEADRKQTDYETAQTALLAKGAAATDDDRQNVATARTAAEEAAAARDKARLALYQTDANSAFKKVIDMAFAPLRENSTADVDQSVREALVDHGVTDQWINKTAEKIRATPNAPIDYNAAIEMAVDTVAVGPPMTIGDRIKSWGTSIAKAFSSVWSWFKGLFTSPPPALVDQSFVTKEAQALAGPVKAYVKKKGEQGANGVKADKVNGYLKSPYAAFVKKVLTGATDQDDRDRRMVYVKNAVPTIVEQALIGTTSGGKVIRKGDVTVDLTETSITVSINATGLADGKVAPVPAPVATTPPQQP